MDERWNRLMWVSYGLLFLGALLFQMNVITNKGVLTYFVALLAGDFLGTVLIANQLLERKKKVIKWYEQIYGGENYAKKEKQRVA